MGHHGGSWEGVEEARKGRTVRPPRHAPLGVSAQELTASKREDPGAAARNTSIDRRQEQKTGC